MLRFVPRAKIYRGVKDSNTADRNAAAREDRIIEQLNLEKDKIEKVVAEARAGGTDGDYERSDGAHVDGCSRRRPGG